MWSYLFGGNGSNGTGAGKSRDLTKKAIIELREHINLLDKKQSHLQTQIVNSENDAKRFLTKGNRTLAKNSLKRKKIYEQQLDKLDGQINSLEQQLFTIETSNLNAETMRAMQQGAKAMKSIHKNMNIDQVDETMDDVREQVELSEEISDAISKPLYTSGSLANDVDEDELDQELELLQQEKVSNDVLKQPQQENISLPNVPNVSLSNTTQEEEEEENQSEDEDERALRELQAEMGL
ncbi:vacuolar-sorting protein Snf7p [Monosporozyma unispora]|nr:ESCRT-III subunit protein snf7 [Kazachstania unispora]